MSLVSWAMLIAVVLWRGSCEWCNLVLLCLGLETLNGMQQRLRCM
jgi:hypothetical protein